MLPYIKMDQNPESAFNFPQPLYKICIPPLKYSKKLIKLRHKIFKRFFEEIPKKMFLSFLKIQQLVENSLKLHDFPFFRY